MPAIAPIPPEQLKRLLEAHGWRVVGDDPYNWSMDHDKNQGSPILIPKMGPLVAVEAMMAALDRAKIDNKQYFDALNSVTN